VQEVERAHATRQTRIVRVADGALIAEALTDWAWVDLTGRPRRIPSEILAAWPSPKV
jgi:acyl-CoA thioesterase FadM